MRKYPFYICTLGCILGADLVIEVWGNFLPLPFSMTRNGFYNLAMLIEFWGYGLYYAYALRYHIVRKLIWQYLFAFPAAWVLLVCILSGINTWNSYVSVIGSIAMIAFAVMMYYQLFTTNPPVKLVTNFDFWVATGLIIFYVCNFTYLGMLNFLSDAYRDLAHRILTGLQISNIVFYCIMAYAFVQLYRTAAATKSTVAQPVTVKSFTEEPNGYGCKFRITDIKGIVTIDNSPDMVSDRKGYLSVARDLFTNELTHVNVLTATNNLVQASNSSKSIAIIGHGLSGLIGTGIGNKFDGSPCTDKCISGQNEATWKDFFNQLKAKDIDSLYLLSCYTGSGAKGAQLLYDLANSINATVVAPTGKILLFPDGYFQLEDCSPWQVAQPAPHAPPAPINLPTKTIPPFTNIIYIYESAQLLQVPFQQIVNIFISPPGNLDRQVSIPAAQFKRLLRSIDFVRYQNLEGATIASFITGAITIHFNYSASDNDPLQQGKRTYYILGNQVIQDSKYPDIVYNCKEAIADFLELQA
jgi:hypothetical protein